MHLSQLPLVKSDSDVGPAELAAFKRYGWHAINYQTQNDHLVRDFDLAPARAAGLSPGVWGVTYRREDFFRDGKALAQSALRLGADHVTMDVETALKNTRPGGARPIIDGIRAGGWQGPVHLNTLGGPVNPRVTPDGGGNDYGFDYASFLETGGGVFLQCYFNMADEYRPRPSVLHALACGVPADRLNVTISLAHSESYAPKPTNRIDGAGWVPLLREAGVYKNLSLFLAKSVMGDIDGPGPDLGDLAELAVITLRTDPPPQPEPEPEPQPEPKEPTVYPWTSHIAGAREWTKLALDEMVRAGVSLATRRKQRVGMADAIFDTSDAKRLEAYAALAPVFGWAPADDSTAELVARLAPHVDAMRAILDDAS